MPKLYAQSEPRLIARLLEVWARLIEADLGEGIATSSGRQLEHACRAGRWSSLSGAGMLLFSISDIGVDRPRSKAGGLHPNR